jgi:hypothetical protein
MSSAQHTQGTWGLGDKHEVLAADSDQLNAGYFIATCDGPQKEANARRIVACVNAMEGIPDDNAIFLKGNSVRKVIVVAEIKRLELEKQRDDLLAALKLAISDLRLANHMTSIVESYSASAFTETLSKLEAVAAKAEAQS